MFVILKVSAFIARMRAGGIRSGGNRTHLLGNSRVRKRALQKGRIAQRTTPRIFTQKEPLKVAFVCWHGMVGGALVDLFREKLQKTGIRSVALRTIPLYKPDLSSLKSDSVFRRELGDTHLIFYAPMSRTTLGRIRFLASKQAMLKQYPDFTDIQAEIEWIRKQFQLSEDRSA